MFNRKTNDALAKVLAKYDEQARLEMWREELREAGSLNEKRQRDLEGVLDAALDVFDLRAKYPDTQVTDHRVTGWAYKSTRPGRLDFHADLLLAAKDAKSSAAYKKIRGTK